MREDHSETRKRAERDPDVDAASCDHSFHMSENAVFTGTEGARGCGTCKHIDVLLEGRWTALDVYLEQRRAASRPSR
jgi:hypothetical protein